MNELRLDNVSEKQAEKKPILMKCGHTSMSVCSRWAGVTYDPPIPSCVICDCLEVAEDKPSLEGRMARCDYFGKSGWRNSGPIYGGGKCSNLAREGGCQCLVPSDYGLPFFSYLGPGSNHYSCKKSGPRQEDSFFCGCAGWD